MNKRGGRKGRGRKGRGRKGKKDKKPFDLAEYTKKKGEQMEKQQARMEKKCAEKQPKRLTAICENLIEKEVVNAATCDAWKSAMGEKCTAPIECKVATMTAKNECEGKFKAAMSSFRQADSTTTVDADDIGTCFKNLIMNAQECSLRVKGKIAGLMEREDFPSEEELKEARDVLKAERKSKRQGRNSRKGGRRGRNNNRRQNRRRGRGRQGGQDEGDNQTGEDTSATYENFDDLN